MDVHIALHCIPDVRSMVLPPENWFYRWDQDGIWSVDARALYCTTESLGTILVAWGLRSVLRRFWVQLKAKWPRRTNGASSPVSNCMDSFFGPLLAFLFFRESKTVTREFNCRLVDDRVECNAIKVSNADGRRQSMSPWNAFPPTGCESGASMYDFRTGEDAGKAEGWLH